ncbi:MAG: D-alanyl-D-alanine carboxypeptidase [Oscillospiraceae bacterium]|nr:D-alanyl-D-alanine carboxypeptidase [Oscillospiraceae bacterium]
MVIIFLLCMPFYTFAAEETVQGSAQEVTTEQAYGSMQQNAPAIESVSGILMDADSGQILYEKNIHQQLPPASITKILTVIMALEQSRLTDMVTASYEAVHSLEYNSSHISLTPDEQITMEQALYATMLPSANDAANVVAENVSGSMAAFVEQMNTRAAELGALNTHFENPNGLDATGHLSTAYDMAVITRHAVQNQDFLKIFGTPYLEIPPTNKQTDTRYLWALHKMLQKSSKYYDERVIGGKSGYTGEAEHTLVTVAQRDGRRLIAVVMYSKGSSAQYTDTQALFDYGFSSSAFTQVNLEKAFFLGNGIVPADAVDCSVQPMTVTLPAGKTKDDIEVTFSSPGEEDGSVKIQAVLTLKGESSPTLASLGLQNYTYTPAVPMSTYDANVPKPYSFLQLLKLAGNVGIILVVGAVVFFLLLCVYVRAEYEIKRSRRHKQRRNAPDIARKSSYTPNNVISYNAAKLKSVSLKDAQNYPIKRQRK